jgi:carboxylesterase type B
VYCNAEQPIENAAELPLVLRLVHYPNSDSVSRQLAGAWAAFARHGNPNHSGLPSWSAYDLEKRATMVFAAENSHQENDPLREARLKFLALPVPQRAGGCAG